MPDTEHYTAHDTPSDESAHQLTPEQEVALADINQFIDDVAPHLGKMFGLDLNIKLGKGWATDLETGDVTVDPRFFLEKGYTSDMSTYATLHEVVAHLREVENEPKLTARVIRFSKKGPAEQIFHNILSDIAGNKQIHAALPRMSDVAEQLYKDKLFPEADFRTSKPRHLQFLYKMIRQEMIEGSETQVVDEVDDSLGMLRNYEGKGDVIKLTTDTPKKKTDILSPTERFEAWVALIYPEYKRLIELDKSDPIPQPSEDGESESERADDDGAGESSDEDAFKKDYDDYFSERHPEPLDHQEHEKIKERVKQKNKEANSKRINPQRDLDRQSREETGYSLGDRRAYQERLEKYRPQIDRTRDIYRSLIAERVAEKRRLSRTAHADGELLDPNRLAQTVIDIKSGITQPEAFQRYERHKAEATAAGDTDYYFVFDRSGSMGVDGKAQAAADSGLIMLEGMAAMQRDVKAAEEQHGIELDMNIRTACYSFGGTANSVVCHKPLSEGLTERQRLETYHGVASPGGGNHDSIILHDLDKLPDEPDRRRILIVLSDGEADDSAAARRSIERLRAKGWSVYGIAIGSEAAETLYAPDSKRVDDPTLLPEAFGTLVEETLG